MKTQWAIRIDRWDNGQYVRRSITVDNFGAAVDIATGLMKSPQLRVSIEKCNSAGEESVIDAEACTDYYV